MQRTYQFSEVGPTHADDAISALLVDAGRKHCFASGAHVLHAGDEGKGFWLILSGQLMACRFGREGERILYAVLGAGDLIGELACFANLSQQMNAIAEGDVELVWIEASQIDELLAKEPDFARWMLNSMAKKLRAALDRIEGDYSLSAKARIARVLVDLAGQEGRDLEITQQQLADFVGVSRVTVGQILSRFAGEGLIERQYGAIAVRNSEGLAKHSLA